jgi:triosephosphate isomerase
MSQRAPLVIANWKLNGGLALIGSFVANFYNNDRKTDVGVCPPFIYLRDLVNSMPQSQLLVGSQTISEQVSGAFTGEISAQMVKEAGARLCLIGHSERRQLFDETNESCKVKLNHAIESGLLPVYCIGENLEEREAGETHAVLAKQMEEALTEIKCTGEQISIAYEPVWAIGTGKAASAEDAQATHAFIREKLAQIFGQSFADTVRILYGGSVKKDNALAYMQNSDIDGLLVGGASLDAEHFKAICDAAETSAV